MMSALSSSFHVGLVAAVWAALAMRTHHHHPGAPVALPVSFGMIAVSLTVMAERGVSDLGRVAGATLSEAWLSLSVAGLIAMALATWGTEAVIERRAALIGITGVGVQLAALVDGGRSNVARITLATPIGPVVPTDLARVLVVIAAVSLIGPGLSATGLPFLSNPWRWRIVQAFALFAASGSVSFVAKDTSGLALTGIAFLAFAHWVLDRPLLTGFLGLTGLATVGLVFKHVGIAAKRYERWMTLADPGNVKQELAALFVAQSGDVWGRGNLIGARALGQAWLTDYMPACLLRFYGAAGGGLLLIAGLVGVLSILRVGRTGRTRLGRSVAGCVGTLALTQTLWAWASALGALPETGISSPFHSLAKTELVSTAVAIGTIMATFQKPTRKERNQAKAWQPLVR
jgi:cell division protein FtsW (lipid II flippase)